MLIQEAIQILQGTEKSPKNFLELMNALRDLAKSGEKHVVILRHSEAKSIIDLLKKLEAKTEKEIHLKIGFLTTDEQGFKNLERILDQIIAVRKKSEENEI